jgi:uncharacterized membrane protein YraQ (UPF0718 family)
MMVFAEKVLMESWRLFEASAIYMIFGLLVAGLLRAFFSPSAVTRHLGKSSFLSVIKAALFGVPIPLCSCGVLPAAAAIKKQGANNGATTAFLISTPESGVDSMAITYALLDPVMTVARPVAAFATAAVAGLAQNVFNGEEKDGPIIPDLSCPIDGCCDGIDCAPEVHRAHHSFLEKILAGFRFARKDLWGDIALWFFLGLLLAGVITVLVPGDLMMRYVGGGFKSMLVMLAVGIPLYICATASTPIAAALILKGVSPGAALVFLLVGPATNVTSLTVVSRILGKKGAAIYLITLSVCAVILGLLLDQVYGTFGISPRAVAGQAAEIVPHWAQVVGAFLLLALSISPFVRQLRAWFGGSQVDACGCTCCTAEPRPVVIEKTRHDGCGCSHSK